MSAYERPNLIIIHDNAEDSRNCLSTMLDTFKQSVGI